MLRKADGAFPCRLPCTRSENRCREFHRRPRIERTTQRTRSIYARRLGPDRRRHFARGADAGMVRLGTALRRSARARRRPSAAPCSASRPSTVTRSPTRCRRLGHVALRHVPRRLRDHRAVAARAGARRTRRAAASCAVGRLRDAANSRDGLSRQHVRDQSAGSEENRGHRRCQPSRRHRPRLGRPLAQGPRTAARRRRRVQAGARSRAHPGHRGPAQRPHRTHPVRTDDANGACRASASRERLDHEVLRARPFTAQLTDPLPC